MLTWNGDGCYVEVVVNERSEKLPIFRFFHSQQLLLTIPLSGGLASAAGRVPLR
jgi:hypothetical protein